MVLNDGMVIVVNQGGTSWSLPKGHIEPGEDKQAAAKREIFEESGIRDLEYVKDLGFYKRYRMLPDNTEDASEFKTIHMMLFLTKQWELRPRGTDVSEAKWVAIAEAGKILSFSKDKDFFESIIAKL